jgi:hypothetical protein
MELLDTGVSPIVTPIHLPAVRAAIRSHRTASFTEKPIGQSR